MDGTTRELREHLYTLIMGDDEYPTYGYTPYQLREKVKELLRKEQRLVRADKLIDDLVKTLTKTGGNK